MVYQKDPTGRLVRGIVNKSMGFHGVYFDVYIIYIYIYVCIILDMSVTWHIHSIHFV